MTPSKKSAAAIRIAQAAGADMAECVQHQLIGQNPVGIRDFRPDAGGELGHAIGPLNAAREQGQGGSGPSGHGSYSLLVRSRPAAASPKQAP